MSGRTWPAAVGIVGVLAAGVGALFAYDVHYGFHMGTVGAYFPDDNQVVLVRTVDLPVLRGRTVDLWWVSLATGKVTQTAREQAPMARDLEYVGVAADRMWFFTQLEGLVHRGARATNDRFDLGAKLKAHPTLGPRFDWLGIGPAGPVVKDQRGASFLVQTNGAFTQLETFDTIRLDRRERRDRHELRTGSGGLRTPSLSQLPLVRAGFPLDPNEKPIRPREGGGFLVIGEELQSGGGELQRHVIVRVDDNGAVRWQLKLGDAVGATHVDDLSLGSRHLGARLRGLHTTTQRVWAVFEVFAEGSRNKEGGRTVNRETRLVQIDAATGKVLSVVQPVAP